MRCLVVAIFILTSSFVFGQNDFKKLRFFTTKDGLTNNNVHCSIKDSRGFLWIGTVEGLNRFDGLQFRQYFAASDISESLTSNSIFSIIEYSYGQLLIGTSNGISVLNTITGKFENEKIRFAQIRMGSGTEIYSFFKDKEGKIWINHSGEVDILDSNLNYIQRFTDLPWATGLKGVKVIFENWQLDKLGRLWLPSDLTGINVIDVAAKQVWNYKNNPKNLPYLKFNYIRSMFLDESSNILWYAPWGMGLCKYDLNTNKLQQQLFNIKEQNETRSINCIIKTNSGNLLCTSLNGLYTVNQYNLQYSDNENIGFSSKENLGAVNLFYDEQNELYWLSTVTGLLQFTDRSIATNLIVNKNQNKPVYINNLIQAKDKLYAIYRGHLIEVERDRINFQIYALPNKNIITSGLCEDKNGIVWIGTSDGVFHFDPKKKSISRFTALSKDSSPTLYNNIFCDSEGHVWLTTRDKLDIYRVNKQMHVEKMNNDAIEIFKADKSKNIITQITEDAQHNLWMVSELGNGILCYNMPSGKWKLFPNANSKNDFILKKPYFLANAIGNTLWLTNSYMGLLKYNTTNDEATVFTRNDGLLSNNIMSTNYDKKDNLWIITERGITQLNIQSNKTKSNGLSNIEIKERSFVSIFDSLSNSIVYSAKDNLSFIHLDKIPFDEPPPVPEINSISVYNKPQFIDPAQKFYLAYDQNTLTFDFTAIQFADADKIKFAYWLTGVDKEWQYANVNRVIQYANLAPGDYTFDIKTGNESGIWSDVYSTVRFTIVPPFWRTWWFIAFIISSVFFSIYFLLKRRIKQIQKEAKLKHEIKEAFFKGQVIERKRVSADLHDEIGSALSTIGIFSDLAKRKAQKSAPELIEDLDRIGLKSREMVQTMRDTIWTISENHSQNIWERMQQYGMETLSAKDISFTWQTSLNTNDIVISFLVKKNVFMAYKEAINNIIKHSAATEVCVNIHQDELLNIEVIDNGIGFDSTSKEKGNGIRNFINRMEEIGGSTVIDTALGKGTKVIFCINTNT